MADRPVPEPREEVVAAARQSRAHSRRAGSAGRDAVFLVLALAAVIWVYVRIRRRSPTTRSGSTSPGRSGTVPRRFARAVAIPSPDRIGGSDREPRSLPAAAHASRGSVHRVPWWLGLALWFAVLSAGLALALWALGVRDLGATRSPSSRRPCSVTCDRKRDAPARAARRARVALARAVAPLRSRYRAGDLVEVPRLAAAVLAARHPALPRRRAALAVTAFALLVPWAVIGFDGMRPTRISSASRRRSTACAATR